MVSSSTSIASVSVGPIHARVYNSVPFTLDPIEGAKWAPCTPVPEEIALTVPSIKATLNVSGSEETLQLPGKRHTFGERSCVQFSEDGSLVRGLLFSGIYLSKIDDRPDYKNQADYVIVSDWTPIPESHCSPAGPKTWGTERGRKDDEEVPSHGEDTAGSVHENSTVKGA